MLECNIFGEIGPDFSCSQPPNYSQPLLYGNNRSPFLTPTLSQGGYARILALLGPMRSFFVYKQRTERGYERRKADVVLSGLCNDTLPATSRCILYSCWNDDVIQLFQTRRCDPTFVLTLQDRVFECTDTSGFVPPNTKVPVLHTEVCTHMLDP